MKWICIIGAVLSVPSMAGQPEQWAFKVVETCAQDPRAFTQGLLHDGRTLILGTGQYGQSSIRRVDLASGATLARRNLDRHLFGEGVARHGEILYQLTWKSGIVLKYKLRTMEPAGTARYRAEGWGLTSDGRVLIMSNGSDVLTGRDPTTFAPVWNLKVTKNGRPLAALNELEYIDGNVFANVWKSNEIVVIDLQSGAVKAVLDCSGLAAEARRRSQGAGVLNGIAYHTRRKLLLVTGKNWDVIYALKMTRSK